MLDLRKIGGALQTECDFPQSYTKFEIETGPKQGDGLQTRGARISVRENMVTKQSWKRVGCLLQLTGCPTCEQGQEDWIQKFFIHCKYR